MCVPVKLFPVVPVAIKRHILVCTCCGRNVWNDYGICLNTAKMSEIAIIDLVFMHNCHFIQQH